MSELRAAGLIIFRKLADEIQYLLMQTAYGEHHWTPPKGHVDRGESDKETALRDTEEEAGLKSQDFSIFEDCRIESKYKVKGKPKTVIYWLAELCYPNTPVVLTEEHKDYKWLPFEACTQYALPELIAVLKECHEYIKNKTQ